jgi:hypothetical protein
MKARKVFIFPYCLQDLLFNFFCIFVVYVIIGYVLFQAIKLLISNFLGHFPVVRERNPHYNTALVGNSDLLNEISFYDPSPGT